MDDSIFDFASESMDSGPEVNDIFGMAQQLPKEKERSTWQNFQTNTTKALIRGVHKLGRAMGPTFDPMQPTKTNADYTKEFNESLDELVPTEESGPVGKGFERSFEMAPSILATPGGGTVPNSLARIGLSGAAGQTAEELGFGELGQAVAEMTAFMGPDVAKKLLESGSNKELIQNAKRLGLSDEQIAPLLQSDLKQKWLTKLSPKRGKIAERLKNTKEGLGGLYGNIKSQPYANKNLKGKHIETLRNDIDDILFDTPSQIREKIVKDYDDLLSRPVTGESLINFWQDINSVGGESSQLGRLKGPLKTALNELSPDLAQDFELVNDLYSKYSKISAKLKPTIVSDLFGGAQALKAIGGVVTGYYPLIIEVAGEQAGKRIAGELLTNPRLQNLSGRIVKALNENKYKIAQQLIRRVAEEIEPIDEDYSKKLLETDVFSLKGD